MNVGDAIARWFATVTFAAFAVGGWIGFAGVQAAVAETSRGPFLGYCAWALVCAITGVGGVALSFAASITEPEPKPE